MQTCKREIIGTRALALAVEKLRYQVISSDSLIGWNRSEQPHRASDGAILSSTVLLTRATMWYSAPTTSAMS